MYTGVVYCYFYKKRVCYVGQTLQTIKKRHKGHMRGKTTFDKFLKFYANNISNIFPIRIIHDINKRQLRRKLNILEILFIRYYNTYCGIGFNYTPGGPMKTQEIAMRYFNEKFESETALSNRCYNYIDMIDSDMYIWTKKCKKMNIYELWEMTRNTLIGHQYTHELLSLYNDLNKKLNYINL